MPLYRDSNVVHIYLFFFLLLPSFAIYGRERSSYFFFLINTCCAFGLDVVVVRERETEEEKEDVSYKEKTLMNDNRLFTYVIGSSKCFVCVCV